MGKTCEWCGGTGHEPGDGLMPCHTCLGKGTTGGRNGPSPAEERVKVLETALVKIQGYAEKARVHHPFSLAVNYILAEAHEALYPSPETPGQHQKFVKEVADLIEYIDNGPPYHNMREEFGLKQLKGAVARELARGEAE